MNIPLDSVVLDPCCGVGNFLFSAKEFGIKNIYGADIDQKAINICKKFINNNIKKLETIFSKKNILKSLGLDSPADYI